MSLLDKAKNLLAKNTDKVDAAIEKVGDIVDEKTQGKYAEHVDKVQEAAKDFVEKNLQDKA
ncbi:antitoxin family protein [Mycolicibacterium hassiacum DSM 44199]|jgi:nucleosome binding factor SPN SPT16 subunit|uniref:Antitoxin family protein n=1 Tax=Mycolicibacterium hassiacum (strain DSM 44199 / CIP 105218 / JCM 12690 / 3849) TaxID=1122247 RepID=K5BAK9_MYCHD|nr:antitoxin [Mycolicibacterium hassiacum]EKF22420.1 antitoxin family protein [Mycolicibacterium hassiacum DSM 44199]MBX5487150.1 antitoxin [Mycolicibacterium hassiacum]MDA4084918.1 kanamycin biosynthetic protein [Mycolicibacterium hassiacum DSM 44199]PZN24778.1 MAG: antitoxin [Mycolicibacterium hassiacum]VCT91746.1 Antitoxin [Mycolicibacterium hassiacum DSM 44199]